MAAPAAAFIYVSNAVDGDIGTYPMQPDGTLQPGERVNMDRSFTDENGKRWIVDYEASGHEGTNVDAFLDQEKERYRIQLERYALELGDGTMLGLYFPLLAGWREWSG